MDLSNTATLPSLIAIIGYALILLTAFLRRGRQEKQVHYLLAFLLSSILWQFSLILLPDDLYPPHMDMVVLLLGTAILGMTTAVYADWSGLKWQIGASVAAVFTVLIINILLPVQYAEIGYRILPIGNVVTNSVWLLMSGYLLVRTWLDYRRTTLPWHANRLLFWAILLFIIFAGEGLVIFGETAVFHTAGQIMRLLGAVGMAYAIAYHRIFDVRTRSLNLFAFVVVTLLTAIPLAAAIFVAQLIVKDQQQFLIVTIAIISVSFIAYRRFRGFIERNVYRYLPGDVTDPRQVVRRYSQDVYQILDVQQLSFVIINTLTDLLNMDRGALVLITKVENGYGIEPVPGVADIPREKLTFAYDSPLMNALLKRQQALLQYDLDFSPQYEGMETAVRDWLKQMRMEAYVPIGTNEELAGFIAIGPKRSGVPYQTSELELVQLLADQTVIALQNARLYSELSTQNDAVRHLNMDLVAHNERLAIMDKVKADFITIASHELRTPLTQVKGYADILAAMNESQAITPKQTQEILGHINRAVRRLEELITAMLDASQLDAEGMQLSFMDTSIDTVVRIAIDPMTHAIKDRRIAVTRDGLADLPPIRADFKRLVQAFSNMIGNAIKYTPDHGNIAIRATLVSDQDNETTNMEIVIADTGIGIEQKYHDLIFEKFFRIGDTQLHSTGSTKFKGAGPGLGLTIAKGVLEAHGGRIWIESEGEDEERLPGSRFHIILPLMPPGSEATLAEKEVEKERPSWLIG